MITAIQVINFVFNLKSKVSDYNRIPALVISVSIVTEFHYQFQSIGSVIP